MLALLGHLPWGLLAATLLLVFLFQRASDCPTKAKQTSLRRVKARGTGEKSEKERLFKARMLLKVSEELVGCQMVVWVESWQDKGTETVPVIAEISTLVCSLAKGEVDKETL